jgi:hypothetical protein
VKQIFNFAKEPHQFLNQLPCLGLTGEGSLRFFCCVLLSLPVCDQVTVNLQEENNNNVVSPSGGGGTASNIVTSSTTPAKGVTSLLDSRAKKFTIAAANPLLAG